MQDTRLMHIQPTRSRIVDNIEWFHSPLRSHGVPPTSHYHAPHTRRRWWRHCYYTWTATGRWQSFHSRRHRGWQWCLPAHICTWTRWVWERMQCVHLEEILWIRIAWITHCRTLSQSENAGRKAHCFSRSIPQIVHATRPMANSYGKRALRTLWPVRRGWLARSFSATGPIFLTGQTRSMAYSDFSPSNSTSRILSCKRVIDIHTTCIMYTSHSRTQCVWVTAVLCAYKPMYVQAVRGYTLQCPMQWVYACEFRTVCHNVCV